MCRKFLLSASPALFLLSPRPSSSTAEYAVASSSRYRRHRITATCHTRCSPFSVEPSHSHSLRVSVRPSLLLYSAGLLLHRHRRPHIPSRHSRGSGTDYKLPTSPSSCISCSSCLARFCRLELSHTLYFDTRAYSVCDIQAANLLSSHDQPKSIRQDAFPQHAASLSSHLHCSGSCA